MYFTYILYSKTIDRYYIGYTSDLSKRLEKNNNGNSRSTRSGIPWDIVYYEEYELKTEALARERAIKKRNQESTLNA
ncbi:MAG: GIY-YIG nuclease family protein [FCB group bacterium]|nr:GIY-YIG nuclease family protein [FCB group bacterium]